MAAQLTAFFESRDMADKALASLKQNGIAFKPVQSAVSTKRFGRPSYLAVSKKCYTSLRHAPDIGKRDDTAPAYRQRKFNTGKTDPAQLQRARDQEC